MKYIVVDYGKDGVNTECVCQYHRDGTVSILGLNQWKHDIDLEATPVSAQQLKWEGVLSHSQPKTE